MTILVNPMDINPVVNKIAEEMDLLIPTIPVNPMDINPVANKITEEMDSAIPTILVNPMDINPVVANRNKIMEETVLEMVMETVLTGMTGTRLEPLGYFSAYFV